MQALDQVLGSASADPDWLDRECDRFDAAWEAGGEPSIEDYLPGAPSVPIEALRQLVTELVMVDLEHRWRRVQAEGATTCGLLAANRHGEADTAQSPPVPTVEQYGERFRRLLPGEVVPNELIVWEFRVRHRWGDHPQVAEYQRRFPDRFAALLPSLEQADMGRRDVPAVEAAAAEEASLALPDDMIAPLRESAQQLVAGGLVTIPRLRAVYDQLPPGDRPQDLAGLAKCLREAGDLTAYQTKVISEGRLDALVLGSYVILEPLGAGGMGQVFKARHRRMDRVVALKLLPPEAAASRAAVRRFQREIQIAAQAEHPNLIAAYDADEAGGIYFLVMPYVAGRDLASVVEQDGPLSVQRAVACAIQAARGLAHLHAHRVIHRDVKPSNLWLTDDGTVKVLDFGLARLALAAEETPTTDLLTSTGNLMGTPDYMAPEQAEDARRADQRSDIYSLGCTLFYLLTARPVFGGDSVVKRLLAHRKAPVPALRAVRPEVPAEVEAVFQRTVAKRPEDRYTSMQEVIAALEACPSPAAACAASPGAGPSTRQFRRRVLIGGLCSALALLLAALATLAFLQANRPGLTSGTNDNSQGGGPDGPSSGLTEAGDAVGVPVDLLALTDVERDAIAGSWRTDRGALVSPVRYETSSEVEFARLRLPYVPPPRYRLTLDVERVQAGDGLILGLVAGARLVAVALSTTAEDNTGLAPGGGVVCPAVDDGRSLLPDQPMTSIDCTVTEQDISLVVSGSAKPVTLNKQQWESTPLAAALDPLGRRTPFLVSHRGRYRFPRLELTPLGPGGKPIRSRQQAAPQDPFAPRPVRRYVRQDAPPEGNGTSWQRAFREVRDALAWAASQRTEEVELWVAKGTYNPAAADGDRAAAFRLPDGIAIYGGFAGRETRREERDADRHPTILSGDLRADDSADPATRRDNCYHVVVANDTSPLTVVDGFLIRDGWADGFRVDHASSNEAGGGLFMVLGAASFRRCTFTLNGARDFGGAVYAYHSAPNFRACRFEQNLAGRGGGLAVVGEHENPRISRLILEDCVFKGNLAAQGGGGMLTWWGDPILAANCVFTGNDARGTGLYHAGGGAVYLDCTPMVFFRCSFQRNTAEAYGGAVHTKWNPQGTFVNCTWYRNSAQKGTGGAIFAQNSAQPLVVNSILWENLPDQLASDAGAPRVAASYSCVQGGWPGDGNIDADPQWGQADQGEFTLSDGSPCRAAGRPLPLIRDTRDLDRNGNLDEPLPIGLAVAARGQDAIDLGAASSVLPRHATR